MKKVLPIQKRVFVLLLALFLGMGTAYAYSFSAVCPTGQTLYYNITDATNHYVEITCPGTSGASSWNGYTKPTGNITLPSSVTYNSVTYIVTSIGNDAFYECSDLTGTLTIPSSVTTIGDAAFYGCTGFVGSLTLPNSVTTIGSLAFAGCSGFNGSLTISNLVTTIGYGAFGWCPNFTGTLTLPNSLMAIEDFSFYDSGFSGSLTIPNTVTSIGECAFGICSFTGSLTLGNSLTSIGEYAFAHCSGFTGSLTIPNSVTTIGADAFYDCEGFTGLALGNSVTTIGNSAFNSCSSLSGPLTIPNSVTTIGEGAFNNCLQFNGTLVIGTGVTSMGTGAFRYCSRLTSIIVLPETPPTLGTDVFANALMNIPVTVPCGSMTAYQTASGWNAFTNMLEDCDPLTYSINPDGVSVTVTGHVDGTAASGELIIPETKTINGVSYAVTSIGDYAFSYCDRFTGSLTIPNTVTTIGESAFQFCTGFTGSLNLSNSLTTIGISAFQDCHNFTGTLTLPNSLTAIEDFSFFDSGFSGSLTIPNTVTSIGEDAFSNCSFTGSLTLGNSLTSIGDNAFDGCSGFTGSLSIPNSVATIGDRAFWGCTGFTGSLTLGNSVTTIGNWAFWNCAALTGSLIIPNSVTTIGNGAFAWCHDFNGTLIIGTGVTSIGESAFEDCTDLNSIVVYPEIPPTLGSDAFANVLTYIPVTVSCGSMTAYQTASGWNAFTNMQEDCDPLTYSINPDGVSVTVTGHVDGTNATGTLTIPETKTINGVSYIVTAIGDYAFKDCSGLTGDLTIPNSVTTIGNYAFNGCTGFSGSLTIPNSVTTIGYSAFNCCIGLTGSLTIPNSVTSIYGYAFYGCSGFTGSLTLGSSLTALGSCVFCNCSNLTSITINNETPPALGADAFKNVPTTIPVYVPCSSLEDYQAAEGWNEFTNMQCIEPLTVYDGTAISIYVPAYIFYFDDFTRSQFVMPAAELADMTGTPITSMTFYTIDNNVPYTTVSSADVYLKEVNYTEISAYEPKASATTVYSGYLDIVSAGSGGEMTIHFSTPYNYQGGNLLIGVENTEDNGWKNIQFYGQTVSGASISGYNASSTGTIPATQQNFIPKTTFGYIPSDCSRPIDLAATDITINSATLDWTGYQDDYDLRYRKRVYFFEDFENGLPSGWTTIDNDGDGYNWHSTNTTTYSHSGSTVMVSYSYNEVTQTGLTPDNWLITPQLDLQGTMKVWLNAFHPSWAQEHFAIYLSTTGNSVSDFTTVLVPETTLTDGQFRAYTADLRAYAGQQGYIAIRHFNCTDMFALLVDDFGIFNAPDGTLEWETINDIEPGYTLNALEPNTDYEWQVRGRDCDGSDTYTEWSAVNSFTTKTIVVDALHPFSEDFEGTDFAPAYWENIPSGNYQWSSSTYQYHSSSHSAFSSWYGDIYLVLPDLELSADAEAAQLSFWSYNTYPTDFAVGNNTVVLLNGGTETVLWSAETVSQEWVETTVDLSSYLGQTISLAFKYAGDNGNGWFVDDVEVSVMPATQTVALSAGVNWFSTYVEITLDDLKAALEEALPNASATNNIIIKSQRSGQTTYNGTRWRGALNTLDVALMYQITVPEGCVITLEGMPIDPANHPISIKNGPNWIGFPFSASMTPTDAFAGFAINGDQISSKTQKATYNNRWRGALSELVPGQGYIYHSAITSDRTFTFPIIAK